MSLIEFYAKTIEGVVGHGTQLSKNLGDIMEAASRAFFGRLRDQASRLQSSIQVWSIYILNNMKMLNMLSRNLDRTCCLPRLLKS
jgi:hypothetical protein